MTPYTTTTLAALRANQACSRGYNLIARHVGLTGTVRHPGDPDWLPGDNPDPIPLEVILDNNGLDDCIWALRAVEGGAELAVAFAIYVSEPYCPDPAWQAWAADWMSGKDRSAEAARTGAEAEAEAAAARAAARAAAWAAAWAAAAEAAEAARTADAAAWAAGAARAAAWAWEAERTRQTEILRRLVRGSAQ